MDGGCPAAGQAPSTAGIRHAVRHGRGPKSPPGDRQALPRRRPGMGDVMLRVAAGNRRTLPRRRTGMGVALPRAQRHPPLGVGTPSATAEDPRRRREQASLAALPARDVGRPAASPGPSTAWSRHAVCHGQGPPRRRQEMGRPRRAAGQRSVSPCRALPLGTGGPRRAAGQGWAPPCRRPSAIRRWKSARCPPRSRTPRQSL